MALERSGGATQSQTGLSRMSVEEAELRSHATVYPAPVYPVASIQANHTGKVVVDVVVAPASKTSPLARVLSSKVAAAPDSEMAEAVLKALKDARYMPFFDDKGTVAEVSGSVAWEFRITGGKPQVIDPHMVTRNAHDTAADDLKIIRRARQVLNSETAWNRADNRQCPPNAKTFSVYCALEKAMVEVTGGFDHRGTVMDDARAAIDEVSPHHPDYDHWLMGYNNDPTTKFADIQKLMQLTEELISKRINH